MAIPDAEPLPVLEALHSTPARRYLSAEPIPDEIVWAILDAAVRGPSGGNQQAWGWVVVTDPAVKQPVAGWYQEGWARAYGARREQFVATPAGPGGLSRRSFLAAEHLAEHIAEAPGVDLPGAAERGRGAAAPGPAVPRSTGPCSSSSWPRGRTAWARP